MTLLSDAVSRVLEPRCLSLQFCRTALSLACRNAHWSVARWLIDDEDVDPVRSGVGDCRQ
jgi:hypothetical protein